MLNPQHSAKISMQGLHITLTASLQNAIQLRFAALLRHDQRIAGISVRLDQDTHHGAGAHYKATARVELPGPHIIAHAVDENAYAALDLLAQKLDRQLEHLHRSRKEKRNHPKMIELEAELPKVG